MTSREIEESMSIAEFKEYEMYFSENPSHRDVSEIQNASLMMLASSLGGNKKPKIENFFVSAKFKIKKALGKSKSVDEMTAEEINQMLGV